MATVFFSYSHADEELRDRLEKHLSMLRREGLIEAWHDRRIVAGTDLDQAISANLDAADVILLLVSADFLASDYCYSREMLRAMERHDEGSAVVVPVIAKACQWHSAPFGKLLAVPKDGKAVTSWANHEEALSDVAAHVRRAVEGRPSKSSAPSPRLTRAPEVVSQIKQQPRSPAFSARSSNLRLKKEFTERDRDAFLHESFDFFAEFFQGSLAELQERHDDIQTSFRRIDANAFTCIVYRDGSNVSECAIRLGSFIGKSITYSSDASSQGNSFNESLSVEGDDQSLYFTSMGVSFGARKDGRLSREAAAELYWSMLLERLQ
jgi:hypothetical protein